MTLMKPKPLSIVLLIAGLAGSALAADTSVADAARNRDITALRAALAKPHAPVNVAEEDGTTALQWAAHWNDAAMVDLLIHAGADAKAVNRYGATPLSEAAGLGNAVLIEALLKAGADPNTRITSDGEPIR